LNFARPELLWLLGIVPFLIGWGARSRRLRRRGWEAIAQRGRPPGDGTPWWIAAVFCTIVAAAQPRWGLDPSDRLPPGHDVVLLIDASRSMGAEDAVPSRLGVARESARGLIEALARTPGNRVAVVAFAGRGVLRCPLTENAGAALDALDRLKPGDVRPGGTDLAAGLVAALDAFDRQEHQDGRTVLVFSDGEDHADRWEHAFPADRLRRERVIVHAIAIGDPEHGHPVPIRGAASTAAGSREKSDPLPPPPSHPLTYRGEPVRSRRVDAALEAVAKRSGGAIIRLGLASADLGALYKTRIEPVALRTRAELRISERIDRFPLFLMAALGVALIGCRPRGLRGTQSKAWPRFRRGFALIGRLPRRLRPRIARSAGAAAVLLTIAGAGDVTDGAGSAARAIDKGLAAYRAGRFEEALAEFDAASRRAPTLAVPRYNSAAARYRLGRYAEAHAGYLEARERAGPALRTKIDYALGNSALASGDVAAAIGHYDDCLASTASGAALDAVRRDAAINREFAVEQAKAVGSDQVPQPRPESREGRDRGRPNPDGSDEGPFAGEEDGGNAPNEANSEDGPNSPGGRRRAGGAGGEGNRGRSSRDDPNSPDRRLDAAIDEIRDARRRRLPDDDTPSDPGIQDDRKDW
jgi:Ca-activated chloride channel family protein